MTPPRLWLLFALVVFLGCGGGRDPREADPNFDSGTGIIHDAPEVDDDE